jgi:hypothetical protein
MFFRPWARSKPKPAPRKSMKGVSGFLFSEIQWSSLERFRIRRVFGRTGTLNLSASLQVRASSQYGYTSECCAASKSLFTVSLNEQKQLLVLVIDPKCQLNLQILSQSFRGCESRSRACNPTWVFLLRHWPSHQIKRGFGNPHLAARTLRKCRIISTFSLLRDMTFVI